MRLSIACCAVLFPLAAVLGAELPVASTKPLPEGDQGLAAKYPKDEGLDKDPNVIFVDGFESAATTGDLKKRWQTIQGGEQISIEETQDNVANGKRSLQITNTTRKDSGGALFKQMKPGFDTVHARYYVKFAEDFQQLNHFTWLMAEKGAPASPMIQAGTVPNGAQRFSTGLEPWSWKNTWDEDKPKWNFYSYWQKMKPGYGTVFKPKPACFAERGKWMCIEFMLKANSAPDKNDGAQAFWVDGKLVGHWDSLTWRSTNDLKISGFHLSFYRERSKQRDLPRVTSKLWFDDVVLATEYIGPRSAEKK